MCQLLGHHPEIDSPVSGSPLCQALIGLRQHLSEDDYLSAQLDADFERTYARLMRSFRGFIDAWFAATERSWVVDKHRDWLKYLEIVHQLDPNCRLLVCVRELGQIYASLEAQHQNTLLLDFPDQRASLSRRDRAQYLFADEGMIGAPLRALESVQDLENALQQRLYYVVFEHLVSNPVEVMQGICDWLGVPSLEFDPQNLQPRSDGRDGYHQCKYPPQTYTAIQPPAQQPLPKRFEVMLRQSFGWFYETFYPGQL